VGPQHILPILNNFHASGGCGSCGNH
jgi:hypothetical protein